MTPGSLESASMTTWTVQLTTLESRAAEHERFSQQIIMSLAEPLRNLAMRYEDLRKQHADYAAKLEAERNGSYADLKKTKGKYDSVCQEVENRRKKIESSYDHGKSKAQTAYQQQQSDMRNSKVGHNNAALRAWCCNDKETICMDLIALAWPTFESLTNTHPEYLPHLYQCYQQTEGEILPRVCP